MTGLDDARQLLASHFPQVALVWFGCGERSKHRVDAFLADETGPFHVLSLQIDGRFVADAVLE